MIYITVHKQFIKNYHKRIKRFPKLLKKVDQRVEIFKNDPDNITLKNHFLSGRLKGYGAFSITGDIRIIYKYLSPDKVSFVDIGRHSQVYG